MNPLIKKIRFFLRLLKVFWQRQKKIVFLSLLLTLFFIFLASITLKLDQQKTERIGIVGKYTTNNPPEVIQALVSRGLTKIAEDGRAEPDIAASWEESEDGREYLFTLREGVFWQDEKPVVSTDINYNFSDVVIEYPDEKHVKFVLKEPFAPFPNITSRPIFKKGLVGLGDYRIESVQNSGEALEKMTLKPVKDKTSPTLIFKFYPTETVAKTAFKLGEIDTLREVVQLGDLKDWPGAEISQEIKESRFVAIFFNNQDPLVGEKSIRQALAYAIQDHWDTRALSPINPNSWAYNPSVKPYDFDLANAKRLLEKAKEEGGMEIAQITLSTTPSFIEDAELIKADWESLGIEANINIIGGLEQGFQALLVSQEIPADPDQYVFWHSTQPTNVCQYKSPKIDKLLEDGRETSDLQARKTIYQDFQKALLEDLPAIFLFHPKTYTISRQL